jgi:DNA polymerase-3 subunit delta'
MIYPWQEKQWQYLMQVHAANRLPHALLFSGTAGLGKVDFTRAFLQYLLCEKKESICQTHYHSPSLSQSVCHACCLLKEETHPNLLLIKPEKQGQAIKIDQIRMINHFAYQSGFHDNYRIIVIHPADSMNINAANALLKTLEEPPLGCLFILISDQAALLPITIKSRCQHIFFPIPEKKMALNWLESENKELLLNIANGAPMLALNLSAPFLDNREKLFESLCLLRKNQGSPLSIALSLAEIDILFILDLIYSWLMDSVKLKLNITIITNQDYNQEISELMLDISIDQIIELIIYLQGIRKNLQEGIHLNKQLLLENLLIRYLDLN